MFFKRNVVLLTFNLSSLALYTMIMTKYFSDPNRTRSALAGTDGVFGAISRATDFLLVESTSLVLEMRELCSTTRRRCGEIPAIPQYFWRPSGSSLNNFKFVKVIYSEFLCFNQKR